MRSPGPHHPTSLPTLRTLGALQMAGSPVTRPKPLLLLAYLAHEGPTDRDRLARLFFASSRDPRDALSTTLRRLMDFVEPAAQIDGRLRSRITTDALEFQHLAIAGEPPIALARYRGSFLQGAPMGSGVELDEWIVSTREHYGSIARDLHLELARRELDRDQAEAAWHNARKAIGLTETFGLDPEPSLQVLHELHVAGTRVPEGWWRATTLGFDRPRPIASTQMARTGDRVETASDVRPYRPGMRRHLRSPRAAGVRKPRRLTDRP